MDRKRPEVVALDVNETLLDLAPVGAALVELGQPEGLLPNLFARTLLTGFAGTVAGYIVYDSVHYVLHHRQPRTALGAWLRRYHMLHHHSRDP